MARTETTGRIDGLMANMPRTARMPGYLSLDQQNSNLFYQVISDRHAHKHSTAITTNTAFSEWGNILYNTTIATAIADRLVENSEVFLLGGESFRKVGKNPPPPAES